MLGGFVSAFRTPDLRRKLLFTLGVLVLYRLGASIPTPGVDYVAVQDCIKLGSSTSVVQLINAFSGGALLRLSVFALGVMPYITASIIVQLLRTLIPRFQALHEEGQDGQAKLTQYTRYITIGFAALQSASYITLARNGLLLQNCQSPLLVSDSWYAITVMILTMTAGTILIMWLGERITERGIGNGMSLLIFTSIASGFASAAVSIGSTSGGGNFSGLWVLLTVLVVVVVVVFVEQSQRRIPVQYAKRMVGRKMLGGTSTYIPIKINMAGVIPVIFASSLLTLPQLVIQFAREQPVGLGDLAAEVPGPHGRSAQYVDVLALHHLLRVLLHGDHVQSRRGRRQHEEVRRLHPRDPAGQADGASTSTSSCRGSPRPARSTSPSSPSCRRSCSSRLGSTSGYRSVDPH